MERERVLRLSDGMVRDDSPLQPSGFLCHQAKCSFDVPLVSSSRPRITADDHLAGMYRNSECSPVPLQPNLLASCVLSVDFLVSNPITVMILFYILHPSTTKVRSSTRGL